MATGLQPPAEAQTYAGQILTNSFVLANWYNGLQFLLNVPFGVFYQVSGSQSLGTGGTAITLDSTQVDTYSGHSNSTNNSRYTFQAPGWYEVEGVVFVVANTGNTQINVSFNYTNAGGTTSAVVPSKLSTYLNAAGGSGYGKCWVQATATGDYIQLIGTPTVTTSTTNVAPNYSWMAVKWIHQ